MRQDRGALILPPRSHRALLSWGLSSVLLVTGCSVTPPEQPWGGLGDERRWAVGGAFPLGVLYSLEGDFEGENLATMDTETASDSSALTGEFGLGLKAERFWNTDWSTTFSLDVRSFSVNDLAPFGEDLPILVESIQTAQAGLKLRHYFDSGRDDRFRPFLGCGTAYLPGVEGEVVLDLSGFGSSNLIIDSKGDPFFLGILEAGVAGHVSERTLFEVWVNYEWTLEPLDSDLSFEIVGETVPVTAQYEIGGYLLGWGLTWFL